MSGVQYWNWKGTTGVNPAWLNLQGQADKGRLLGNRTAYNRPPSILHHQDSLHFFFHQPKGTSLGSSWRLPIWDHSTSVHLEPVRLFISSAQYGMLWEAPHVVHLFRPSSKLLSQRLIPRDLTQWDVWGMLIWTKNPKMLPMSLWSSKEQTKGVFWTLVELWQVIETQGDKGWNE